MSGAKWKPRAYQCTFADLEPWLQQLHEDHGVMVNVTVQLEGLPVGLKPAVRVVGRRWRTGQTYDEVFNDWKVFDLGCIGMVESIALQLISHALMTLENDKWIAERGQSSLFA